MAEGNNVQSDKLQVHASVYSWWFKFRGDELEFSGI